MTTVKQIKQPSKPEKQITAVFNGKHISKYGVTLNFEIEDEKHIEYLLSNNIDLYKDKYVSIQLPQQAANISLTYLKRYNLFVYPVDSKTNDKTYLNITRKSLIDIINS